jgi:hypothetical protein
MQYTQRIDLLPLDDNINESRDTYPETVLPKPLAFRTSLRDKVDIISHVASCVNNQVFSTSNNQICEARIAAISAL